MNSFLKQFLATILVVCTQLVVKKKKKGADNPNTKKKKKKCSLPASFLIKIKGFSVFLVELGYVILAF